LTVRQGVAVVLIVAVTVLTAGCGSDSSPTTSASSPKKPATTTTPTKEQESVCKEFGGVSPNQRLVPLLLKDGTRCQNGIVTNGSVTISRPDGGWKVLIPPH
jgi:hypothetical protein